MALEGSGDVEGGGESKGGTGLEPNVAAGLSYVLGLITGIIFVMLEKNRFVRFHAFQSIILSVAWIGFWVAFQIISLVLSQIPVLGFLVLIIGFLLGLVLGLGAMVLWIVLIVSAFQGRRLSLPYIGPMAERYAEKQLS